MKKTTIVLSALLLVFAAAGTLSAQGYYGRNMDKGFERTAPGPGMHGTQRSPSPGFSAEPSVVEVKTVTGDLVISDNNIPSIKYGREELTLMMPVTVIEDLKLKSGSKISVKGFEVPGRTWNISGEKAFKVMEIVFDGKTYMVRSMMHSRTNSRQQMPGQRR